MDRREALKKLAAGGAAAAGATAVLTSTAFADGGSAGSRPTPSVGQDYVKSGSGNNTGTVTFTFAPAPCPYVPTGGPANARIDIGVSVVTSGTGTSATGLVTTYSIGTNAGNTVGRQAVVNISWGSVRTITFRVDARYVCKGRPSGTQAAWRCSSQEITYTVNNGAILSNTPTFTPVGQSPLCDSPAPAL